MIIGVGNTAMDCCRSSLRLGAKDVKVMARKPRQFFKASEWELEDAEHENVEIVINHAPKSFVTEGGRLTGMMFEKLEYDIENGDIKATRSLGDVFFPCDDVILAIGQENAFPWIEKGIGIELDKWNVPKVNTRHLSIDACRGVFRRRCGFRPEEHHLVRRTRPSGRHFDPQVLPRRGRSMSACRAA